MHNAQNLKKKLQFFEKKLFLANFLASIFDDFSKLL